MNRLVRFLILCAAVLTEMACAAGPANSEPRTPAVRILAIGNSFSMDAVEENLWDLAAADGHRCEIGNLYIGGCSLERHVENARRDASDYEYRTIVGGRRSVRPGVSLREALCDGEWDYVSVQQVSQLSGVYGSYGEWLSELMEYVRSYAPQAEIVLHETWAYAADSDHPGFVNYGNDQQQMYDAITHTVGCVAADCGIARVIPAGTAIRNARCTAIGDNLTRDGYHLNALGRYTAACAWFETLFGGDVRTNGYFRNDIDREQQRLARESAHAAVMALEHKD